MIATAHRTVERGRTTSLTAQRHARTQMIALMGASGAGKTTLLDMLSLRKSEGMLEGKLLFDGVQPTVADVKRNSSYIQARASSVVNHQLCSGPADRDFDPGHALDDHATLAPQQDDAMYAMASVEESVQFTAEMKLGPAVPLEERRRRVESVIASMRLTDCRATCIGNRLVRGISGGERKRTSVACGLLSRPRALFLDEPTSGASELRGMPSRPRPSEKRSSGAPPPCSQPAHSCPSASGLDSATAAEACN